MTDETKALGVRHAKITGKDMRDHWGPIVERIADEISDPRDDLIETQARENERLREGHREVFEQWAGSEGFIPETAPEAYLLQLTKRMADIARAALAGDSHD